MSDKVLSLEQAKSTTINNHFFTQEKYICTDILVGDELSIESMNKKSQELELRNIMQGLEEFATFMSFRGNSAGLRILSVESIDQPELTRANKQNVHIVKLSQPSSRSNLDAKQSVNKALSFQDREYH